MGNRTYSTIDGVQTAYSYDANDRLTQQGGTTYVYDANGNTLSETEDGISTTYTYDARNKMVSSANATGTSNYAYNINGIRTGKTEGGVTTRYLVDHNQQYAQVLAEVQGGVTTKQYTYGDDLLSQQYQGESHAYLYDGLGSTRALADSAGAVSDEYSYEAFGQLLSSTGNTDNTYRFTGEQYDAGLDQYYLRARYYSQNSGRFTQMDTWNGSMNDPIALHKYLYANANPTMYVDPTGKFASLGEFGVAFTVLGLGVTAAYQQGPAFGSAFNTGLSMPEFQHGAGQSALWNVLALVQFNAKIHSSANAEAATVSETDVKEHGHHTIPVYLCGGVKQETSRVMQKDHVLIHSEMATIRLAIKSAHEYAYRTIGRKRSSDVLHLARSEMGREAISAALENFYKSFSWWRVGVAPIGDVFTRERLGFVSGRNTSLPWCTRGKGS